MIARTLLRPCEVVLGWLKLGAITNLLVVVDGSEGNASTLLSLEPFFRVLFDWFPYIQV